MQAMKSNSPVRLLQTDRGAHVGQVMVDFVVRNRLHLLPAAALLVWATPPWYNASPAIAAAAPVLLIGFGLYQLNRVSDGVEDSINDPRGYAHTKANRGLLRRIAVLAMSTGLALSLLTARPAASALLAAALFLGIAYSIPVIARRRGSGRRLKEFGLVKNILPSVVWPTVTILYPALYASDVWGLGLVLIASGIAIGVFTIEVAWDVRDAVGDRIANVKTLANSLGPGGALAIPLSVGAAYALLILFLVNLDTLPLTWLLPALALLLLSVIAHSCRRLLSEERGWSHLLVVGNIVALILLGGVGHGV